MQRKTTESPCHSTSVRTTKYFTAVAANAAVATTAALLRLLHGQDEIAAPSETGASSKPKVSTTLEPEASVKKTKAKESKEPKSKQLKARAFFQDTGWLLRCFFLLVGSFGFPISGLCSGPDQSENSFCAKSILCR